MGTRYAIVYLKNTPDERISGDGISVPGIVGPEFFRGYNGFTAEDTRRVWALEPGESVSFRLDENYDSRRTTVVRMEDD